MKKNLLSLIGSACAAAIVVPCCTSCGSSGQSYSELGDFGNYTITSKADARKLLEVAKSHLPVETGKIDLPINYSHSFMYWELTAFLSQSYSTNSYKEVDVQNVTEDKFDLVITYKDDSNTYTGCEWITGNAYSAQDVDGINRVFVTISSSNELPGSLKTFRSFEYYSCIVK